MLTNWTNLLTNAPSGGGASGAFVADTSTAGFIHATSAAGKQQRLAYDADTYVDTTVDTAGYVKQAGTLGSWRWQDMLFLDCASTTAYMGPLLGNEMILGGEGGAAVKFDSGGGSYATRLAFYNATPIERAVLATGTGKTVDNVITALQNLGLVKQS